MAIQPAPMDQCDKKCRCLTGPNEGNAYNCETPCGSGETFVADACDCAGECNPDECPEGVDAVMTVTRHLMGSGATTQETVSMPFSPGSLNLASRVDGGKAQYFDPCDGGWKTVFSMPDPPAGTRTFADNVSTSGLCAGYVCRPDKYWAVICYITHREYNELWMCDESPPLPNQGYGTVRVWTATWMEKFVDPQTCELVGESSLQNDWFCGSDEDRYPTGSLKHGFRITGNQCYGPAFEGTWGATFFYPDAGNNQSSYGRTWQETETVMEFVEHDDIPAHIERGIRNVTDNTYPV